MLNYYIPYNGMECHKIIYILLQEDLQMTVRGGRHRLTGMVSLGKFHDDMKKIESGKLK